MRRASGQSGPSGVIPRTKSFSRSVSRKSFSRSQSRSALIRVKSRSFEAPVDSPPTDEEAVAYEIRLNKNDDDAFEEYKPAPKTPAASTAQSLPKNPLLTSSMLSLDDARSRGSYTKSQVSRSTSATTGNFKFARTQNRYTHTMFLCLLACLRTRWLYSAAHAQSYYDCFFTFTRPCLANSQIF